MSPYAIPGIIKYNKNYIINIDKIVQESAHFLQISVKELQSPSRQRVITEKRMLIMNYLYLKGQTLSAIGKCFNRDHTTAIHAIKTIKNLCQTNPNLLNTQTKLHYHLKINTHE